jgi:tRNA threonylcarbamoyladenosine biosynthesis protein TsaB
VIVLGIESATELAGVALADDDGVIAVSALSLGRRHAESIAPAIESVCRQSARALAQVDVIAVDVGPGLFTGLRVGVATAKALAYALALPVVTASSLEVLAQAVAPDAPRTLVVPVVDARRAEVFTARLRRRAGVLAWESAPTRRTPARLAEDLAALGEPFVLVGNGARRYRAELATVPGASLVDEHGDFPQPGVLAALAVSRGRAGDTVDGAVVVPHYLRDADTRINWERRAARVEGVA